MPIKHTTNRAATRKTATTLDVKHSEFLHEFALDEELAERLKNEITALKQTLRTTSNEYERLDIKDEIQAKKANIRELKKKRDNYFLDNSRHIFDYFENKKSIASAPTTSVSNKTKEIFKFFKIKTEDDPDTSTEQGTAANATSSSAAAASAEADDVVSKYLNNVSDEYLDVNSFLYPTDVCKVCHRGELIPVEEDGNLVCNHCCRTMPYLVENDKQSYKDPPKEVCFYAYRKINHFKEILAQFQGKETTHIPDTIMDEIKRQIKKERLQLHELTYDIIKSILRKLGRNKYYEHIPFIKDKLGIKPPVMPPELEETLYNLFNEVQPFYPKYCHSDRVNFLHYNYTVYKLCELLGEDKYLKDLPLLKNPEKIMEQDIIWKQICKELDWEFIPTPT